LFKERSAEISQEKQGSKIYNKMRKTTLTSKDSEPLEKVVLHWVKRGQQDNHSRVAIVAALESVYNQLDIVWAVRRGIPQH